MKHVAANLTPLATCPAFMLWHLIGAAMCIPALLYAGTSADPEVGGYVATFILPVWSAFVLTSATISTLKLLEPTPVSR